MWTLNRVSSQTNYIILTKTINNNLVIVHTKQKLIKNNVLAVHIIILKWILPLVSSHTNYIILPKLSITLWNKIICCWGGYKNGTHDPHNTYRYLRMHRKETYEFQLLICLVWESDTITSASETALILNVEVLYNLKLIWNFNLKLRRLQKLNLK